MISAAVIRRFTFLLFPIIVAATTLASPPVHERTVLAPVFTINDIYKSMMGPSASQSFLLEETEEPELLWLVGYRAEMVNEDATEVLPQEYMCHSNLDIDMSAYRKLFGWRKNSSRRLFTLSQGQFEVNFPEGFAIPLVSWQPLQLNSQVLNLNDKDLRTKVRHRVTLRYIRDRDLNEEITPLFMKAAQAMVRIEGSGYWGMDQEEVMQEEHGESCLLGDAVRGTGNTDSHGNRFSGHWVVPPGEHDYRSLVTNWLSLPFDTQAHYVAVHLHPFSEYIELFDLTTNETVYRSNTLNRQEGIGLDRVDYFSSPEGLPLHKTHEYQIRARYNNTSGENQDSMAVMFFYVEDKEFRKPTQEQLALRLAEDRLLKKLDWSDGPKAGQSESTNRNAPTTM